MKPAKVRCSPTSRAIPEWIGKHPDSEPPPHVVARIFDHWNGRCHISRREIAPGDIWQLEHIVPLADGGENRESNLAPALVEPHREKSAAEAKARAKVRRTRLKHIGAWKAKRPMRHPFLRKRVDGTVERRAP